jgi:hypothetical protein
VKLVIEDLQDPKVKKDVLVKKVVKDQLDQKVKLEKKDYQE